MRRSHLVSRFSSPLALALLVALATGVCHRAEAQSCKKPVSMILLDRSSSMTQLIGAQSKWTIARDAIDSMLQSADQQIEFGLMYAAAANLCDTGPVAVVPKLGARTDIVNSINATTQTTLTPLYGVLYSSWQELKKTQYDGHPKSVILVTDGGESCHKFANNILKLIPELNALVAAMTADGISVYIVGFGDAAAAITLNQMAVSAKTERITPCNSLQTDPKASDNCYYNAADAQSLKTMLQQIALKVTEEKCDGLDNNCDGKIDENLYRPCDTACGPGTEQCVMGVWQNCTAPQGNGELCNGKDDDCDGKIDNGFDVGASCTVGVGECQRTGKKICSQDGLSTVCDATPGPKQLETCNGKDDDCDGTIDNGFDLNKVCSVGVGECKNTGVTVCNSSGNGTVCNVQPKPSSQEICDGKDNDCDGKIDNGFDVGTPCTVGTAECQNTGVKVCNTAGTGTICKGDPLPGKTEICNGKDDDCDGVVDNGFPVGQPCTVGVGECQNSGVYVCNADGTGVRCSVEPKLPAGPEICDGKDNDCNGKVDDNLTRPCSTLCGSGTETCVAGKWVNCTARLPEPETCDNQDNDCNGEVDDNLQRPCSTLCGTGTETCVKGVWQECTAPKVLPEGGCGCQEGETRTCGQERGVCFTGSQTCQDRYWSECLVEVPVTIEVCDGLDNDCDGHVDNGKLCGPGAACHCGSCAPPCGANGTCDNGGQCLGGFCVVDKCPNGLKCEKTTGQCMTNPLNPLDPDKPDPYPIDPDAVNDYADVYQPDTGSNTGDDASTPGPSDTTSTGDDGNGGPLTDGSQNGNEKSKSSCQQQSAGDPVAPWLLVIVLGLFVVWRRRVGGGREAC